MPDLRTVIAHFYPNDEYEMGSPPFFPLSLSLSKVFVTTREDALRQLFNLTLLCVVFVVVVVLFCFVRVCVSQADGCTVISPSTQSTLTFSILISSYFCFIIVCVVKLNNNTYVSLTHAQSRRSKPSAPELRYTTRAYMTEYAAVMTHAIKERLPFHLLV